MDSGICVVIPTYNQDGHLVRALSSVIWQKGSQDEIIVVDDASSAPVADMFASEFGNRVMWLRNEINRGVSFSRNQAILRSRAEWIKFLDADDVLAPFINDCRRGPLTNHLQAAASQQKPARSQIRHWRRKAGLPLEPWLYRVPI